jgi:four helix bundle protein
MLDALRKLDAWRRASRFAVNVYELTQDSKQYAYRDQVTRSALSIASNIAEGYERDTPKDRIRFLYTAKGSCAECWTQLMIGSEANLIDPERAKPLIQEAYELTQMIRGLILRLQRQAQGQDHQPADPETA